MKSLKNRNYEQVRVSSLLAVQAQREEAQPTMDLDTFYIGLGQALKAQRIAGTITSDTYESRMRELQAQYRILRGN